MNKGEKAPLIGQGVACRLRRCSYWLGLRAVLWSETCFWGLWREESKGKGRTVMKEGPWVLRTLNFILKAMAAIIIVIIEKKILVIIRLF